MENTNKNVEELFNPNLSQMYNDKFQELIFRMDNSYANYRVKVLKEEIETQKVSAESDVEELKYVASLRVLLDLIQQGWVMDIRAGALYLLFSSENSNNKDYIKYRLSFERNAQFEEKSIVQFIERMEKKRNFEGREISIKSLIGDSTALINKINNGEIIVSPYIQQVTNDKDIYTGYKLSDIWRYFRYTWSIPYKTMPGRNIYYLVRDEAQENHPVIGIFALGNLGIHLVIATQRPSASIVTTALKANIPVRISFRLPAHQDSMTILDRTGAEDLLGKGDMLAMTETDYYRMQGFYISEEDLQEYLRKFKDE